MWVQSCNGGIIYGVAFAGEPRRGDIIQDRGLPLSNGCMPAKSIGTPQPAGRGGLKGRRGVNIYSPHDTVIPQLYNYVIFPMYCSSDIFTRCSIFTPRRPAGLFACRLRGSYTFCGYAFADRGKPLSYNLSPLRGSAIIMHHELSCRFHVVR